MPPAGLLTEGPLGIHNDQVFGDSKPVTTVIIKAYPIIRSSTPEHSSPPELLELTETKQVTFDLPTNPLPRKRQRDPSPSSSSSPSSFSSSSSSPMEPTQENPPPHNRLAVGGRYRYEVLHLRPQI